MAQGKMNARGTAEKNQKGAGWAETAQPALKGNGAKGKHYLLLQVIGCNRRKRSLQSAQQACTPPNNTQQEDRMDTNISDEVAGELDRLGRPEWRAIIQELADNFDGYPFDDPETQSPLPVICAILRELPRLEQQPDALTDEQFIYRLSRADTFTHRAFRHTPSGAVFWNPLRERYHDFARIDETSQYQAEHEHPAPDIIRAWFYHKLKKA